MHLRHFQHGKIVLTNILIQRNCLIESLFIEPAAYCDQKMHSVCHSPKIKPVALLNNPDGVTNTIVWNCVNAQNMNTFITTVWGNYLALHWMHRHRRNLNEIIVKQLKL